MYRIEKYNCTQDLTDFFKIAESRGFYNNSSKDALYNNLTHFNDYAVHLLYYNETCVGNVSTHSLEELNILGVNAYRIAARTCLLPHDNISRIYTKKQIVEHQGPAPQILIPTSIEYAGRNNNLYISSNKSSVGTQKLVHEFYCPLLNKTGVLCDPIDLEYRGSIQSFWKMNVDVFYNQLKQNRCEIFYKALTDYLNYEIF